jgi:hypothetical protein
LLQILPYRNAAQRLKLAFINDTRFQQRSTDEASKEITTWKALCLVSGVDDVDPCDQRCNDYSPVTIRLGEPRQADSARIPTHGNAVLSEKTQPSVPGALIDGARALYASL